MYDVSLWLRIETGLISMDQEKDFDRVEHQYLWQTLEAFGFNPGFIAMIKAVLDQVCCTQLQYTFLPIFYYYYYFILVCSPQQGSTRKGVRLF